MKKTGLLPLTLTLTITFALLTGCNNTKATTIGSNAATEATSSSVISSKDEVPTQTAVSEENINASVYDGTGKKIQMDSGSYYSFAGGNEIRKYNRKNLSEKIVYAEKDNYRILAFGVNNSMIYFLEESTISDTMGGPTKGRLMMVSKDGTKATLIDDTIDDPFTWNISIANNMLYLETYKEKPICISYDISSASPKKMDTSELLAILPTGYTPIYSSINTCSPIYSINRFGRLYCTNKDNLAVSIDPKTKKETNLQLPSGSFITYITPDYILSCIYNYDENGASSNMDFYKTDLKTCSTKKMFSGNYIILGYDDSYVYTSSTDGATGDTILGRVSLSEANAKNETLLKGQASPGSSFVSFYDPMPFANPCITPDGLFYEEVDNYQAFLFKLSNQKSQKLGTTFFDSHIEDYAKVERLSETVLDQTSSKPVYKLDLEYPVLNGTDSATKTINSVIKEHAQKSASSLKDSFQKEMNTSDDVIINNMPSTYTEYFTGSDYLNDNYISLSFSTYNYPSGAAHGMSGSFSYFFDRKSGKELALRDIIGNSEDEIKTIVLEAFKQKIDQNENMYDPQALDVVKKTSVSDYNFSVTKDGIQITYEPYALAAYAVGPVSTTIPFDAFNLKIELK